jgi:4-aminobutyrate aminotransferase
MAEIYPEIVTALPGPKAAAIIAADERVTSPSYTRGYPLVMDHGYGAMVVDPDGNRFLDFCAGIAVNATGHSHPAVVKAITDQAQRFLHMSGTDFYYDSMAQLAQQLADTSAMGPHARVLFSNSGTEAIEAALKLARHATGRQGFIAFAGAFHGRTMGALSLNASKVVQRQGFGPLIQPVAHVPYPNPYRMGGPQAAMAHSLEALERLFKTTVPPNEVAAIVVEPIQGEGGYIVPPDGFLTALRQLADRHGMLIVIDEVQAGNGRTGKLWAFEHEPGFVPDIIATAKGLASGLPLGAVVARQGLMKWPPGAHASTFGGNPLACAAALATLDLLHGGLMQNATIQGQIIMHGLRQLQTEYPHTIGDVRGRGLMIGLEMITTEGHPNPDLRDALVDAAFYKGLLVLGCGTHSVRLCPPLVICQPQAEHALAVLRSCLQTLLAA